MPIWLEIEKHLGSHGLVRDPSTQRFFQQVNYYGQVAELDNQGRVLIHQRLRDQADMSGEVDVVGSYDYLEVWNHERLKAKVQGQPFTDEDAWALVKQRG
jgi:MraZ protein